jgi:hypothetical protein
MATENSRGADGLNVSGTIRNFKSADAESGQERRAISDHPEVDLLAM